VVLAVVAGFLVVLVAVSSVITLPYTALLPGNAISVGPLISIGAGTSKYHGDVMLTDVEVAPVRLINYLPDLLDSSTSLIRTQDLTGGLPQSEFDAEGVIDMEESQMTAEAVALRQLGEQVPERDAGVVVYAVVPGSPSWKKLDVGDVITAVGPVQVTNQDQLEAALRDAGPGVPVTLTVGSVTSPTVGKKVTVRLGSDPQRPGAAFLGITGLTQAAPTQPLYDFPVKIKINDDGIGGPSAGLAFTIGILDKLSGGNLTGGTKVAATGTMRPDGSVGQVGGVAQKTVAVAKAGARVFIVPQAELGGARAHPPAGLRVFGVGSLAGALHVLESLGGTLGKAAIGPPPGAGGHSVPFGWQEAPWS
jgi:PDZ domain-containing protein